MKDIAFPPEVRYDLLLQTGLFKGLSLQEIKNIVQQGHSQSMFAGEFYFMQDDPAERIYALIHGRVKLTQCDSNGEQILLQVANPYQIFGAVAVTRVKGYYVSAQAAENSLALYWNREDMMTWLRQIPILAMNAIELMAQHAQEVQERFQQLATQRVERRLANTLLRLASQTGKKILEGVLIDMPVTRQDLAEMSGMTQFTVSRLLKQWEEQKLVISKREHIIISYPHGLVCIAEDLTPDQ